MSDPLDEVERAWLDGEISYAEACEIAREEFGVSDDW